MHHNRRATAREGLIGAHFTKHYHLPRENKNLPIRLRKREAPSNVKRHEHCLETPSTNSSNDLDAPAGRLFRNARGLDDQLIDSIRRHRV